MAKNKTDIYDDILLEISELQTTLNKLYFSVEDKYLLASQLKKMRLAAINKKYDTNLTESIAEIKQKFLDNISKETEKIQKLNPDPNFPNQEQKQFFLNELATIKQDFQPPNPNKSILEQINSINTIHEKILKLYKEEHYVTTFLYQQAISDLNLEKHSAINTTVFQQKLNALRDSFAKEQLYNDTDIISPKYEKLNSHQIMEQLTFIKKTYINPELLKMLLNKYNISENDIISNPDLLEQYLNGMTAKEKGKPLNMDEILLSYAKFFLVKTKTKPPPSQEDEVIQLIAKKIKDNGGDIEFLKDFKNFLERILKDGLLENKLSKGHIEANLLIKVLNETTPGMFKKNKKILQKHLPLLNILDEPTKFASQESLFYLSNIKETTNTILPTELGLEFKLTYEKIWAAAANPNYPPEQREKINKIIDNGVGNKTLDEIKKVLNINDITEILAILSKEDLMEFMSKWEIVEEIPRTIFQTVLQQNPEKERLIDEIQQRFFNKLKESSHIQELTRHELKLLNITENDLENPLLQPIIDELEICLAKDLCIKRSPSIMPTFTKYNHLNTDNSKQKIAVASAILQFYYFTPDEQDYLNQKIDDIMVQLNNIKNSNDPLAKQTLDEILFKMYTKEDLFANLPKEPTTTLGYILNPISNFWGKYIVDPIINNEKIRGMISTATTLGAGSAALSSQIPIIGQSPISSGILSATAVLLGGYIGYKYPKLQYVLTPIQSLKNEIYNIVDLKKSFIHKTFRLGMIGLSTAGMLAGVGTLLITATSPLSLPVLGLATLGVLATPMITLAVANITKKIAEKSSFLFYGTEYPDLYYPSEKAINMFKSNNNSNKEALNKMLTISSHFINVTKDIKILMRKYSDEATIKQLKIHLEEIEKIWQQDLQNGNHNGLKRFITLAKIIKIQKKPITPEALYKLRDILIEDYASIDKMSIHKDKTTSLLFQQSQTFMQQKDAIINAELKNLTALENELNVTSKSMSR